MSKKRKSKGEESTNNPERRECAKEMKGKTKGRKRI